MASNYEKICEENRLRYGTDIARIGPMLLADRYDDRTHFIFELLQNAEDALRRRENAGPRKVTFELTPSSLTLSHFGRAFDEADVRGVCGIAESTKDKFSIGRFGIGFKSVYTFTDRPEIHSGDEDFVVENYVQPRRATRIERKTDETKIILPLHFTDDKAQVEITAGFRNIGPGALLFLRHIDEINWSVQGGASGVFLRSAAEILGDNVQRITVIGQESENDEVDQNWLVFHRDVFSSEGENVGRVELAFALMAAKDVRGGWAVQPVGISPLVVFFPTVVPTNLGFLVQGPYRTTPSRDNIPKGDPWNQHLVAETANTLVEAMRWLRDHEMLNTSALRCLPLNRTKFPEGEIFAAVFDEVKQAFITEQLLPCFGGGFAAAGQVKLARTQELRELFSPNQVAALLGTAMSAWITAEITVDREPEVRHYLTQELGIPELTTATILPYMTQAFLEAQSDVWIMRLYEFLNGQEAALKRHLDKIPLLRLESGGHVTARENGKINAFLPSTIETGYPTVRRSVCATAEARGFLESLGLTEPDPVDDVIRNVLPRYRLEEVDAEDTAYTSDIDRILAAFSTDSKTQREKLLLELRRTPFVMAINAGEGAEKRYVAKADEIYLATERLKQLFAGVNDVYLVDDSYACLRGDDIRDLLEACGALRYPRPVPAPHALTWNEKVELRRQTGYEETSGINDRVVDWELEGFDALIDLLPRLNPEQRVARALVIWESLGDLEERRGRGVFDGSYSWSHYGDRKTPPFPAAFLRHLNNSAWVPDISGELVPPTLVVFDSLGWKLNPFLLTKLRFKPPVIDQLAKEAGIDPAALDLLRKLGITNVADLTSRLGIAPPGSENDTHVKDEPQEHQDAGDEGGLSDGNVYDEARDLYGDDMPDIPPGTLDLNGGDGESNSGNNNGQSHARRDSYNGQRGGNTGTGNGQSGRSGAGTEGGQPKKEGHGNGQPHHGGSRTFVSYLGVHPNDEAPDPDGLTQGERMQIEEHAIVLIIAREPGLQRTPDGNPGFDLFEASRSGSPTRWVEVKAMTGSLEERPVGLSRTQFELAREKGNAYWLYVVEHATTPSKARILRIQNPVSLTRTFTFDRGWSHIALTEPPGG